MNATRLRHLYIGELRDLYNAEKQLLKALPAMAEASMSEDLRANFREHVNQTKEHLARLREIFTTLGELPKGQKSKRMKALIRHGAEVIEGNPAPEELDAGLISAAQRVEHYEIAGYGYASAYAKLLGEHQAVVLAKEDPSGRERSRQEADSSLASDDR